MPVKAVGVQSAANAALASARGAAVAIAAAVAVPCAGTTLFRARAVDAVVARGALVALDACEGSCAVALYFAVCVRDALLGDNRGGRGQERLAARHTVPAIQPVLEAGAAGTGGACVVGGAVLPICTVKVVFALL